MSKKGLNEKMKDEDNDKKDNENSEMEDETMKEALDTFRELLANAYRPEDQPDTETWPEKKSVPDKSDVELEEGFASLFEGQEISEDFKTKLSTIFEAKIHEKVCSVKEKIEEAAALALSETVVKIKAQMEESVDNYLSYVATQFIKENEIAITEGLRYEIAESFMSGLKSLFVEHNVQIPEEKVDLVSVMEEKVTDLETLINEMASEVAKTTKELNEMKEKAIFESLTSELAATEKDRLAKLAESITFTSEDDYSKKLGILIESYSGAKKAGSSSSSSETMLTEEDKKKETKSPGRIYADFINRTKPNSF